ncbi:hypothetical protein [Kitasatospora sp. NPDC093806]|uniref:hypothetical protein n=1 Tax=Kitasatospora sp. NPDC093806 TaxID=3155075 RepID=UPI003443971F
MFRSDPPPGFRIPTDRETALAFGEEVAVLRDAPADWGVTMGRQSSNGFVCQIDVDYHLSDGESVATVSTYRPPPGPVRPQLLDAEQELWNFLANSGRSTEPFAGTPYLSRELRLGSLDLPVHVHEREDCFSAWLPRLPHETGCIVLAGVSAYWPMLAALVLRAPADFPDTHFHNRR